MNERPRIPRIPSLEGLRGLLSVWVVAGHTLSAAGLGVAWHGLAGIAADAVHAVDVFIILSGFVIFYLLDTAAEGYARFLWRRALRLYPVYLICLLAAVALLPTQAAVFASVPWAHPANANRVAMASAGMDHLQAHLAVHLLMVQTLIPDRLLPWASYSILGQAWSLSLEWQFYVVAPLAFYLLRRDARWAVLAMLASVIAHGLCGSRMGTLPHHLPFFAVGIASYFAWRARSVPAWPLTMPAGAALALLVTHDPALTIWAAVFLAALDPRSPGSSLVNRLLSARPLTALGRWSYSIYLSHMIVLVLALRIMEQAMPVNDGQWPFFAALLALTSFGTLGASTMLYRFVEAPCIALGRRLGRSRVTLS